MKTREYKLGGKNPLRTPIAEDSGETVPTLLDKGDYIPMNREHGDSYSFQFGGKELIGAVQRSWGPLTLIIASDGDAYLEDTRKPANNQIRQLNDSDLCVHCGAYFCTSECPNYHNAPEYKMSKTKTLTVFDVLSIEPGDKDNTVWINDEFEAVISNVKEAKGNGPATATAGQASAPNNKITVNFWKVDPSEFDGKLVKFSGKGMKRSVYKNKFNKTTQQVDVSDKTDIEVIGEAADSKGGMPPERSEPPDNGRNASDRPRTPANSHPADDDESIDHTPVNKRIFDYFKTMAGVVKAHGELKEKWNLPEFSPSDIKEITTGICMGYKGKYGVYRAPIFPQSNGVTEKELAEQPEKSWEGDKPASQASPQSTENLTSWKSCPHPRRKNEAGEPLTIGEMTQSDRLKYCRWAATIADQPDEKGDKLFYANIKMLMASKGWSDPVKLLSVSLSEDPGYGEAFIEENINQYTQAKFSKDLDDIDSEEALIVCSEYDDAIKEIMEFASKPKKATKKTVQLPD